jgi:hypothetical protein
MISTANRGLLWLGRQLATIWLALIALCVLLSFLVVGLVVSFCVGGAAAWLINGGTIGVGVFFVAAYFLGLFLSVYVWSPYVKEPTLEISEYVQDWIPKGQKV